MSAKKLEGFVTIEWLLAVIAIVVPLAYFAYRILELLAENFTVVSWGILIPFP